MSALPIDYEGSWTLGGSVERSGIGLHSGKESVVTLMPFDSPGFYVSWANNHDHPVCLLQKHVRDSQLCTTIELNGQTLSTIEHLLAALAGCGLTHVHIKVLGNEIPLLDGSALGWVEAIEEVGLIPAANNRKPAYEVIKPIIFSRANSLITAIPSEKFRLVGVIDFPQKAIGKQSFAIDLTPENFVKDIAPARTFGFLEQVEALKASGLIKGGGLDNALVCDGDLWVNPPLRYKDEPIRHKLLDLIGDLALVGFPKAQVLVYKGSHGLHSDLAKGLLQNNLSF